MKSINRGRMPELKARTRSGEKKFESAMARKEPLPMWSVMKLRIGVN